MIIIGAGLAGAMARSYFSSYSPEIYESRGESGSLHKAILRFKDSTVGFLLGVPLEKISVSKSIYYKGQFVNANPMILNLYSLKISHGIYERSVISESRVTRYIANSDFKIFGVHYGKNLEMLKKNKCFFSDGSEVDFDICLSTVPLPVMAKAVDIDVGDLSMDSYDIFVARYPVFTRCNVYQTIYFPDPVLGVYRATLEPDVLIIESINGCFGDDLKMVFEAFGFSRFNFGSPEISVQKMGKIVEVDNAVRKDVILRLTEEFGVYSFGRYATWRNITSDDLLNDLKIIDRLLKMDKRYQGRLESAK